MRIKAGDILIRGFTEGDLPLMLKWLTDERVLEYYEERDVRFTMDTLAVHYLEEIPDGFRMIIEHAGAPIGYSLSQHLLRHIFWLLRSHRRSQSY